MEKKTSFILSGIISFSFYIFICILFAYYVATPKVKTYNIKSTATVMELDVIVEQSDKKRVEKKEDKKIEKQEIVVEKATSVSSEKKPDLKSLFGNVKTNETKIAKEEVNNVVKSLDPKRFKAKFEKQKKSSNVKIDKLLDDKKTTTNQKAKSSSKEGETDEYYSKVRELLDMFVPTTREDNLKAVVLVIIDLNGRFDYRFVTYSENNNFDNSLKAFLEEQKSIIYPKPERNKTLKINVDFKSEG